MTNGVSAMLTFTVMSFNLWCGSRDKPEMLKLQGELINAEAPDIIGVQEALSPHMKNISECLPEYYIPMGQGRDGETKGEYSALFVNSDRFKILDGGTRWLSETPDDVSAVEGSCFPRILTWAKLYDRKTHRELCCINVHLDCGTEDVRLKQTKFLLDFAKTIDLPILVTGDFNASEKNSASYSAMVSAGFDDAKYTAKKRQGEEITWQNFGNEYKEIIDFCFLKRGCFEAELYKVVNSLINGAYASDHNAVVVKLGLK